MRHHADLKPASSPLGNEGALTLRVGDERREPRRGGGAFKSLSEGD